MVYYLPYIDFLVPKHLNLKHCTEVHVTSFLSREFTTTAVIIEPETKLAKRTSAHCLILNLKFLWFIDDLDYLNRLAFCILMNGIQTFGCSLTGTRTRTVSLMGLSRYTSTYLIGSRYWTPDPPFRPDCTLAISEKQKKKYYYRLIIFRLP